MHDLGRIAARFLLAAAVLAGSDALAAERYRCTTQAIRDCQPSGCTEQAETAEIDLDMTARTLNVCIGEACRTGVLEPWEGKPDTVEKGIVAFSQPDKAKGLTGMADLDRGEFVMIDGTRYLMGRCVTR